MVKRFYLLLVLFIIFLSMLAARGTGAWFTSQKNIPAAINAATLDIDLPIRDLNLGKVYPGYVIKGKSIQLSNTGDLDLKFKVSFSPQALEAQNLLDRTQVKIYTPEEMETAPSKSISEWIKSPYEGAQYLKKGEQRTLLLDFQFDTSLSRVDFENCKSLEITVRATQIENNENY